MFDFIQNLICSAKTLSCLISRNNPILYHNNNTVNPFQIYEYSCVPFFFSRLKRWAYLAFYQFSFTIALSLYFGLCLWAYLDTLDGFSPRFKRPNRNQALMFRPLPDNHYSTLIHFKHGMSGDWQKYKVSYSKFSWKLKIF